MIKKRKTYIVRYWVERRADFDDFEEAKEHLKYQKNKERSGNDTKDVELLQVSIVEKSINS